jgi:hypothetical protein
MRSPIRACLLTSIAPLSVEPFRTLRCVTVIESQSAGAQYLCAHTRRTFRDKGIPGDSCVVWGSHPFFFLLNGRPQTVHRTFGQRNDLLSMDSSRKLLTFDLIVEYMSDS